MIAVGAVPDEVLLQCGQPGSMPSAWWTPTLVDLDPGAVDQLLAAARDLLEEHGVRDPATGRLTGPLGLVAEIAAGARVLLLLETERPGAAIERRSMIVAEHEAVLDRQDPDGFHDLLLAGTRATVSLLADLLTPAAASASPTSASAASAALAGRRTPAEVTAALPEAERTATIRITRVAAGDDPGAHMVTVVDHPQGAVACWAAPDGAVEVQPLDADGAVDLSLALLGAQSGEVAA